MNFTFLVLVGVSAVCAVAISALNFSKIAPEIGSGYQLAYTGQSLARGMATIAANYHASNFRDDVAPVKLMSAGGDAKTRHAFGTVWKIQPDARSNP